MDQSLEQKYHQVLRALESAKYENKNTPVFSKALEWITCFPRDLDLSLRRRLIEATCKAFSMEEAELWVSLDGVGRVEPQEAARPLVDPLKEREDEFRRALPSGGWFEWYDVFTEGVEVPLSYSIFSGLCAIGSALGRRVYLRMGHFNVWPNYCVILIGPPGLKKTTAGDISAKLIREQSLCPSLADQVTPERMITVLKQSGHHFIYAAEMSVFFGKQRYNEGLVTKMLRILDSPAEYIAETQAREQEVLRDLAVSFIGCTTPSLLSHSMPEEVTSSGFMSRFVVVVERDTWREFHIPKEPSAEMEKKLKAQLERLKGMTGEMRLLPEADKWYEDWYHQYKKRMRVADDTAAEMLVRSPMHLLRTAMLTHLVQCDNFHICPECLQAAARMLAYTEEHSPRAVQAIKQISGANDMDFVMATILKLGGAADHSTVLRRVATRMNTETLKKHIRTLEEQAKLKVGKRGGATYYIAIQEGGEHA